MAKTTMTELTGCTELIANNRVNFLTGRPNRFTRFLQRVAEHLFDRSVAKPKRKYPTLFSNSTTLPPTILSLPSSSSSALVKPTKNQARIYNYSLQSGGSNKKRCSSSGSFSGNRNSVSQQNTARRLLAKKLSVPVNLELATIPEESPRCFTPAPAEPVSLQPIRMIYCKQCNQDTSVITWKLSKYEFKCANCQSEAVVVISIPQTNESQSDTLKFVF